jgi:antitoxin component YwqK of YwqJK toxin-antitoxin module
VYWDPSQVETEDGRLIFRYPDRRIRSSIGWEQGRLQGESLLYWPNGVLKRRSFFVEGLREEVELFFTEEGIMTDRGSYRCGVPVGLHERWDRSGRKIEEVVYDHGQLLSVVRWDQDGERIEDVSS